MYTHVYSIAKNVFCLFVKKTGNNVCFWICLCGSWLSVFVIGLVLSVLQEGDFLNLHVYKCICTYMYVYTYVYMYTSDNKNVAMLHVLRKGQKSHTICVDI